MIERKSASVEVKVSDAGIIEAAFAQLNVIDHDGDVTLPGAFPTKAVAMSAYGHASWDGALPVGKGIISEEGDWAVFRGEMFLNTTHGRDAYETLKALGSLAEFSYGYSVTDSAPGTFEGRSVRYLKALDPFEVSHVLKGAGLGTHLRAIKGGAPGPDAPYADHATWVREAVEAFLGRSKARAEMREQAGRKLSRADREALTSLLESLRAFGGTADELAALLEQTDPQKSDGTIEALLARARLVGVSIPA